jgi:integrase
MTTRNRLPPGARWVELPSGQRRVEIVLDVGIDPATGARRQTRRRFRTVAEAVEAYATIRTETAHGTYVARATTTVQQTIEAWLSSRHGLRASTLAGYRDVLKPVTTAYGGLSLRNLEKHHVVTLVEMLREGRALRADGQSRRPWKPRTVNLMLFVLGSVLADAVKQGLVARNVVALVDRLPQVKKEMQTLTPDEVEQVLAAAAEDDLEHAWHLALYGLRRGEVAGLRWSNVDLDAATLTVSPTRVSVDGAAQDSVVKTERGERTLPLTPSLAAALARARARQDRDAELAGSAYAPSGLLVVDQIGRPLHPETISSRWDRLLTRAGVRRIRLHDARHTCGTTLHLQGVPVAVIAAWLGHADSAFTMRTYVHSQDHALWAAAASLAGSRDIRVTPEAGKPPVDGPPADVSPVQERSRRGDSNP